jgi:hypothetical protein
MAILALGNHAPSACEEAVHGEKAYSRSVPNLKVSRKPLLKCELPLLN